MTKEAPTAQTYWEARFDPASTDIEVLAAGDPALADNNANITCSYNDTGELHMLSKPMPTPGEGEVVLHVHATGICGSDVHFWKHGGIGDTKLCCDVGAGHESAGEVIAVGSGVTKWKVGDRVAIEAGIPCGQASCEQCVHGDYNLCPHMVFHSCPPYHGTLTRYLLHPAAWLYALPDSVSYEEGALCEPLAVGLAAVERSGAKLGDGVLVCGAGPIGIISLLCAAAAGCSPLVITDVVQSRLEFARKLVPRVRTVLVSGPAEETAKAVRAAAKSPIRVALECTGREVSIDTAINSVAPRSTVMVVGMGGSTSTYPIGLCSQREIDLRYLFRYTHQYPKAIKLIADGVLDVKPLVTHRYQLANAIKAFNTAADPSSGAIKVQILD